MTRKNDSLAGVILGCMFRFAALLGLGFGCLAQTYPAPVEGDYIVHDFVFKTGEKLADLRLHYTTIGTPARDASGHVNKAVLIMHGTGGTGHSFDARDSAVNCSAKASRWMQSKYFIILPDAIGHGKSSKPSDGLRAHFPQYCYRRHGDAPTTVLLTEASAA